MARRLERRLGCAPVRAQVMRAPAEAIPAADASFDYVVCTLVLRTVPDPPRAPRELGRVLKPGGRLLFLEHVRAGDPRQARWQDRLDPLWVRIGHGCHCNCDTLQELTAAGFSVSGLERAEMPRSGPLTRPLIVGSAATQASS